MLRPSTPPSSLSRSDNRLRSQPTLQPHSIAPIASFTYRTSYLLCLPKYKILQACTSRPCTRLPPQRLVHDIRHHAREALTDPLVAQDLLGHRLVVLQPRDDRAHHRLAEVAQGELLLGVGPGLLLEDRVFEQLVADVRREGE